MESQGGTVSFRTDDGVELPAVTGGEMREVDRVAVDEFGLGVLQMMENAGAAAEQFRVLAESGVRPVLDDDVTRTVGSASVVIDALIGYGLEGAPRGRVAELIVMANLSGGRVLSLDVPSGVNATTGDVVSEAISPGRTLTLALPKTGLARVPGALYVADIGIPLAVYERLSIVVRPFFRGRYSVRVSCSG